MFDREIAELKSFTLMRKITKKLSIKFKILSGKRKENSVKLVLDIKSIKLRNFGKPWKSLGLPSKAITASNICLKDKNEIV